MKPQKITDKCHRFSPKLLAWVGALFLLTSCLPQPRADLDNQPPVTIVPEMITSTPPVTWFPATSTPTSFPHVSSTPAPVAQSGIGDLISDSELSDAANWSNAKISSDSPNKLVWNDHALYFAVNQPPVSLSTINNNFLLTNFYLEVNFEVNRCSPNDTYGISFLAANERFGDRFILRCDGHIRVVQARDSLNLPLTAWEFTGAAPPSAPGTVKASIWVYNGEMRFFLNDQIQFTVTDRYFSSGGFGFFVDAKDPAGMNIKIHDLKLYSILTVDSTATAVP